MIDSIICLVLLIICIIEVRQHNEKVEELWPDETYNQKDREMRREMTVSLVGHYFFLLILIGFLIKSIIQEYIV